MATTSLFGLRFELEWFGNHSKVYEFLSILSEEYGRDPVERSVFNVWLTETTKFCLPVDVALLARELINRGYVVAEPFGVRGLRYTINHEVINDFLDKAPEELDFLESETFKSESQEVSQLVSNLDTLRVMLRALLTAYRGDFSATRMSYVGMAKEALGSVGMARITHKQIWALAALLMRRGFIRNFPVQHDVPGRLELRRESINSFLATGVIPWTKAKASFQTSPHLSPKTEEAMETTQEFDAENLRVIVKTTSNRDLPKLAATMLHTLLKEAGFLRGVFTYQAQGSWADFSTATNTHYGKVMSSSGPAAFIGLKCGGLSKEDSLSGHLSGTWGMKFTAAWQKLTGAAQRLNSSNWSSVLTRETETANEPLSPGPGEMSTSPAQATKTGSSAQVADPTHQQDESNRLESLMTELVKHADENGLLTTGQGNELMKSLYPERNAHGLFTSLFGKLRARGWLRRVYQDEKVVLQIGIAFLNTRNLPIHFKERPEVPSVRKGPPAKTHAHEVRTVSIPPASVAESESRQLPSTAIAVPSGTGTGHVIASLKQLRELMQQRDSLESLVSQQQAEIDRLSADLVRSQTNLKDLATSIEKLTRSLSHEDLIALALEKI